MFSRSLQVMSEALQCDIYRLKAPGTSIDQIKEPDLDPISPLKYSCIYWVNHLNNSHPKQQREQLQDNDKVHEFLKVHFLHWLEAMCLMGKISECITAIKSLESCISVEEAPKLFTLVHDAKRFVLHNRIGIEQAPLQIYCSALFFAPENSVMREKFQECIPNWICKISRTQSNWSDTFQMLEGHSDSVRSIAFSPDGKVIASGSGDETIRLWDVVTGAPLQTLEGHSDSVRSIAFSPDGKVIASGSGDETIRLWDVVTGEPLQILEGHSDWVTSVAFSPDGKVIASGSGDKTIRLWDVATGEPLQTLKGHWNWVASVAFSPDGKVIASGSWDDTICLWDTTTGKPLQTLKGHSNKVRSIAFSPDGKVIASVSLDNTIWLWDIATGSPPQRLEGRSGSEASSAFERYSISNHWIVEISDGEMRKTLWLPPNYRPERTYFYKGIIVMVYKSGGIFFLKLGNGNSTAKLLLEKGADWLTPKTPTGAATYQSLHDTDFIHRSITIKDALKHQDFGSIEKILTEEFDSAVEGEYEWLQELREEGYTALEMAELLWEDVKDSPWIYFDRQILSPAKIDSDHHLLGCVHQGGITSTLNENPKSIPTSPEDLWSHDKILPNKPIGDEYVRGIIAELCGLAGVAPDSRQTSTWNGYIMFENDHSVATATFALPKNNLNSGELLTARIVTALERFCQAVGLVQKEKFCCNSFTILRRTAPHKQKESLVELCNVPFVDAKDLLSALKQSDWKASSSLALSIIKHTCDNQETITKDLKSWDAFHLSALAVQCLSLGFLSYSQAHIGALRPFFLDNSLKKIFLRGSQQGVADCPTILANIQNLTCMGDMVGDHVFTFTYVSTNTNTQANDSDIISKSDLLGSPENIMDTWGPGQFIIDASHKIYAIKIGGGTIMRMKAEDRKKLHWAPDSEDLPPFTFSFSLSSNILIGAPVKLNIDCVTDEKKLWRESDEFLYPLGTFQSYWEVTERQGGVQGGQYVIAQYNNTWAKMPGTSLKQHYLGFPENNIDLPFLQCSWGLQLSFCTAIARRVPLRELIADAIMSGFVESRGCVPRLWENLKTENKIIEAFQGDNLADWMSKLNFERQTLVCEIVRDILKALSPTGIYEQTGGTKLIIAWIRKGSPLRCFKIPCEKESYWARILVDSHDCATFAYITSKCLETNSIKCSGRTTVWKNSSLLLETSVCRYRLSEDHQITASVSSWTLENAQPYLIGSSDNLLRVRVEKPDNQDNARLHVIWSMIPVKYWYRLKIKMRQVQRLREKQEENARAERVQILAIRSSR